MIDTGNRQSRRMLWVGVSVAILLVILIAAGLIYSQLDDDDETETTFDEPTLEITLSGSTPVTASAISVVDPWVRATIGSMATEEAGDMQMSSGLTSAAFMVLENHSDQPERLVSAVTDVAAVVEIHETVMENDIARMSPVDSVDIPANGSAELQPGGIHIMLMDVQRDLQPGDVVTLTLNFESGLELVVEAPVQRLE